MLRTRSYKQWQKRYTEFKRSIRLLARLGVLDTMCQQVRIPTPSDDWQPPDWTSAYWKNALYQDILAGQVSTPVLDGLIRSVKFDWFGLPSPSAKGALAALDLLYRRHGKELRQRFHDEMSGVQSQGVEGMGEPSAGGHGVPPAQLSDVWQELGDAGDCTARAEDAP